MAFLIGNQPEKRGYGLYSYLIFLSKPRNETERQRYLAVIKNLLCLQLVQELEAAGVGRENINSTFIPVKTEVPAKLLAPKEFTSEEGYKEFLYKNDIAQWVLSNYNYGRAQQLLLSSKQRISSGGPYIISAPKPLCNCRNGDVLVKFHFTGKPVRHVSQIVDIFRDETSKCDYWRPNKMRRLVAAVLEGVHRIGQVVEPIEPKLAKLAKI